MKGFKRFFTFLCVGILLVLVQSCNMPNGVPPTPADTNANATLVSLALTQTAIAGTIPEEISPVIMINADTDCRSGPGEGYDILMILPAGDSAEVIGKYTSVNPAYWIIKKDSTICWLWGQSVTLKGDISSLPEMSVPALSAVSSGLLSATPMPSVAVPPIIITPTLSPKTIITVTPTFTTGYIVVTLDPSSIPPTIDVGSIISLLSTETPTLDIGSLIGFLPTETPTLDIGSLIGFLPTETPTP